MRENCTHIARPILGTRPNAQWIVSGAKVQFKASIPRRDVFSLHKFVLMHTEMQPAKSRAASCHYISYVPDASNEYSLLKEVGDGNTEILIQH